MTEPNSLIDPREFQARIEALVGAGEFDQVFQLIETLPDDDRPLLLSRLGTELHQALLSAPDPRAAAELLHSLPEAQAIELLDDIPASVAADLLEELPQNEQADLVGELSQPVAAAILLEMDDPSAASRIRSLAAYEDDQAGGIMHGEFVAVTQDESVGQVIEYLRANAGTFNDYDVQYVYVTDRARRLRGVLRLRDLLLAEATRPVRELMIADPFSVTDRTDLNDLHDIFLEHDFLGIPVVGASGELTGVVGRAAVEEALGDRTADDFLKTQGIIREELRTMPLVVRSRRRLAWLSINIGLNVVAASVIAFYQETLSQVIALAVFLPIISDMSGCSGNQAVAVSMRELSLGLVDPRELLRVLWKEASVGLINGVVLGLLIALVAMLWQGNAWLGLVVGGAMMLNTLIAVSLGGCLPLAMRRFGMDPALASGPILTTVTDMCGFLLVLSFASAAIERLV